MSRLNPVAPPGMRMQIHSGYVVTEQQETLLRDVHKVRK